MIKESNYVDFNKIYMTLSKENYIVPKKLGTGFGYRVMPNPEYEIYRKFLNRVGKPFKWHLRPRIQNVELMTGILKNPLSRFFILQKETEEIGYCLIEPTEEQEEIEISDFGFFPEYINQKLGHTFFPCMVKEAFDVSSSIEKIVLTTRSTNHSKVPNFYKKFGFEIVKVERQQEVVLEPDIYSRL